MNNPRVEFHENDEGVFRVKIFAEGGGPSLHNGKWLEDTDTMSAIVGSHRSQVLDFPSLIAANLGATEWIKHVNMMNLWHERANQAPAVKPPVSDTFKKL